MLLKLSERSGAGNGLPKACPDSRAATQSPNTTFFGRLYLGVQKEIYTVGIAITSLTHSRILQIQDLLPKILQTWRPS